MYWQKRFDRENPDQSDRKRNSWTYEKNIQDYGYRSILESFKE